MAFSDEYDFDAFDSAASDLSSVSEEYGTSLQDEFGTVYDALNAISKKHDSFLSEGYLEFLSATGDSRVSCSGYYSTANQSLNKIINTCNVAYSQRGANSGGGVDTGGGTGGSGGGGGSVSTGGYSGGDYTVDPYTPTDTPETSTGYSGGDYTVKPYVGSGTGTTDTTTSTPTSSSYRDISTGVGSSGTSGGNIHTGAAIGAGGGALGSAAVGGLGGVDALGERVLPTTNYPLGNYSVNGSVIGELPKDALTEKLADLGFTDEEIESIMKGEYDVSKVLVEEISGKLAEAYKADSGIREYLNDQYGFDIFNEDGSVNNDKLSLALYMDDKSGLDNYSIISTLSEKYGINIVDQVTMKSYMGQFESMFMKDSKVRDKFKEQYGFDIYNPDGTVNKDRLALAMLIDEKSNGKYSISKFLKDAEASSLVNSLGNNMTKVAKARAAGGGKLPYMVGAAAVGAAAVGAGIAINKKKEQQNDDQVDGNKFITELNYNEEKEKEADNYWVQDVINEKLSEDD